MNTSTETPTEDIQEKKLKTFIEVQLGRGAAQMSLAEKKTRLNGKFRKVLIMMALNLVFLAFFTVSFLYDITQLSGFWYNLIIIFFVINSLLYVYQWRQLRQAVEWIDAKLNEQ